jgi:hypothetical protein
MTKKIITAIAGGATGHHFFASANERAKLKKELLHTEHNRLLEIKKELLLGKHEQATEHLDQLVKIKQQFGSITYEDYVYMLFEPLNDIINSLIPGNHGGTIIGIVCAELFFGIFIIVYYRSKNKKLEQRLSNLERNNRN